MRDIGEGPLSGVRHTFLEARFPEQVGRLFARIAPEVGCSIVGEMVDKEGGYRGGLREQGRVHFIEGVCYVMVVAHVLRWDGGVESYGREAFEDEWMVVAAQPGLVGPSAIGQLQRCVATTSQQ